MAAPVKHAVSWWQIPAGWLGIKTGSWCNVKVRAVRREKNVTCRECLRAVRGER